MTLAEPSSAHLEEPSLVFGGEHRAVDPKTGLSLFGPHVQPKSPINIGIIGDNTTVAQAEAVLRRIARRVPGSDKRPTWTLVFPGISMQTPFKCELNVPDKWICTIKGRDVDDLETIKAKSRRIGTAIRLITAHMAAVEDRDEMPDVFVCAIPRKMFRLCMSTGAQSGASHGRRGGTQADGGQEKIFSYFTDADLEKYEQDVMDETADNFHGMLKAQAMRFTPRTQVIRPDTLDTLTAGGQQRGQKKLQDESMVAWNLATGLLYKSGCRLWRPARMPGDTCFVGVSFYRARRMLGGAMHTSMAQVFTPEGEGFVMRGDEFPWANKGSPHLDGASAERLLGRAVEMYTKQTGGRLPRRIVLHKSSKYAAEELEGFKSAAGSVDYDFVAILGRSRIAMFRQGEHPVLRGTMAGLPGGRWLLYTSGYVPFLGLYPGPHTPNPLEIVEHFGDAPIRQVCQEILMLTKLNWNNADFSSHLPITLQFARKVGEIMKEAPEVMRLAYKYMYYM